MRTTLVMAIGLACLACEKGQPKATNTTPPPAAAQSAAAQAPSPKAWNDSQVLATILAINQGEVDMGNSAMPKLGNKDAKDFAEMMVKDHSDAVRNLNTIAAEQRISPLDNDTSLQLKTDAATKTARMASDAASAGYDRAYMTAQVDGHKKALQIIDTDLLSNVTNATLRDAIRDLRGHVQEHLAKAQSILQGLPAS